MLLSFSFSTIPSVHSHAQKLDKQMTGEDLRRTINHRVVNISDSEFKELTQMLDPGGTRLVSVSTLLQLFEGNREVRFVTASPSSFCGRNLRFAPENERWRRNTGEIPECLHALVR